MGKEFIVKENTILSGFIFSTINDNAMFLEANIVCTEGNMYYYSINYLK